MVSRSLPQYELRCSACPDCCKHVRVPLTHFDLCRLVAVTNLDVFSHVEWLSPSEIEMGDETASFVELREGRRLLVLAHEHGGCRYLSAEGLCLVYSHRPLPCAAYPYCVTDIDGQRLLTRLPDAPCVTATDQPNSSNTTEAFAAAAQVDEELRQYVARVAQFNRMQWRRRLIRKPLLLAGDFFRFLGVESR